MILTSKETKPKKTCLVKHINGAKKSKKTASSTPLSTDGIDICEWTKKWKNAEGKSTKMYFTIWDFAGQEVYYCTHRSGKTLLNWKFLSSILFYEASF